MQEPTNIRLQEAAELLKKKWGHDSFRPRQEAIISSVLNKNDTLVLLPTGGGKSVCYQIPALLQAGVCLVVSPLLALMQDQVDNLTKKDIKAVALNKPMSQDELVRLFDNIRFNNIKFVYISPEKLQSRFIQEKVKQLDCSLVAIDEAHCISEWGHDFRPSYLQLSILKEICPKANTIALTATATSKVLKDIATQLQMKEAALFKSSFQRPNLAYQIFEVEDKLFKIKQIFNKMQAPAILYCQTRNETKKLSKLLNAEGYQTTFYHGGLSTKEKQVAYNEWYSEKKKIMIATNAFGMGIDKPNIRVVIHLRTPNSIENYIQEAGRGGRDGNKAFAVTLLHKEDLENHYKNLDQQTIKITDLKKCYFYLNQYFKIAKGEYNEKEYSFSLNEFCQIYQLDPNQTYTYLKALERQGVLNFFEGYQKKTQLKFTASSNQVLFYCERHPELAPFIKTILRNYGGLFENFVHINEYNLSKRLHCSKEVVVSKLIVLENAGLLKYLPASNQTRIQFLVPREDDSTINRISKRLKEYEVNKRIKAEAILDYSKNNKTCRSKQLLAYFGEKQKEACGICDVCLSAKKEKSDNKAIQKALLELLNKNELSSREITSLLEFDETAVLNNLSLLVEAEKACINRNNKYHII